MVDELPGQPGGGLGLEFGVDLDDGAALMAFRIRVLTASSAGPAARCAAARP